MGVVSILYPLTDYGRVAVEIGLFECDYQVLLPAKQAAGVFSFYAIKNEASRKCTPSEKVFF